MFQTHVFGPLGVARAFMPHFRSKRNGTFVFMGSIAAWGGLPALGAYCSSKAALRGWSHPYQTAKPDWSIMVANQSS